MELITGIQKAIDYIDTHLLNDLTIDEIAKQAYVSPFHFQRVFHILSGFTVSEYIRNRRLSLAAAELQRNVKVVDTAIKYGYNSSESFSRAFERFHGVLPSMAKNAVIKSFSRLNIKVILEGGSVMDYRFEKMDGIRLLGKAVRDTDGGGNGALLWKTSHKDGTLKILTEYSTSPDKELIGIMDGSAYDPADSSWLYYVATPYNGDAEPEGFVIKEIPARTWAKFRCFGMSDRDKDAEIWRKIYSEFLPTSDYDSDLYAMEVYYYDDGNYSDDVAEVWIDVKKKAVK